MSLLPNYFLLLLENNLGENDYLSVRQRVLRDARVNLCQIYAGAHAEETTVIEQLTLKLTNNLQFKTPHTFVMYRILRMRQQNRAAPAEVKRIAAIIEDES